MLFFKGYKKYCILLVLFIYSFGFANSNKYHLATSPVKLDNQKPDFANIKDVAQKKKIFIDFMSKEVKEANNEICSERKNILDLQKVLDNKKSLNQQQSEIVKKYTNFYKISDNQSLKQQLNDLMIRVNIAPESLVIAQAILETGWGTSRFAAKYNNYFGLHCFEDNCGVKAKESDAQVEVFNDVGDSVLAYYYKLNTGGKFVKFRQVRASMNMQKGNVDDLINTLGEYSSLEGQEYQKRLKSVIKYNHLDKYVSSCDL
ncbi:MULTISPECIES: glucosaminidase domain-containing protein [unclassified Francisella]|uniref:glucosaminidase domain-containing protein n=1 Tax=unclassified Francisella TaxID=2610885 RepID=UPI002E349BE4|nr:MULTISPECIES: glucosaminidase domain-containing protein [unclassified Francisella]MED7819873.1 glucosaminidase domain-containing protein [Francisella sp. 19S2-4]MED7830709.1 glucosaminidase domain-containing protein [Francisella sp. 19S2-10]